MTVPTSPLDPDACYRAMQAKDARFDGRFFVCVPKRENWSFAASAEAAEAAGGGAPLSTAELETMSQAWRPWRGYAALALWTI
ncbi:MAG: hypothetical protein H5U13_10215 [Parvibaculum sp.]|nr:hypothetical protein [Parvibaculum sp.]